MTPVPLAAWHDFYLMLGTASGAIVGATFVVATLAAEMKERIVLGIRGFVTPTAVHLGSVLVGSAALTAPTVTPISLAVILGTGGVAGVIYGIVVATRIWHIDLDYSDRAFYVILPILAYGAMAIAAAMACRPGAPALDTLGISLVMLLIIGIRNAWDMATFMIMRGKDG